MHSFTVFTAVFLSLVGAFIVPRATQPDDWPSYLEQWAIYHARYLKFNCETKHETQFFLECCNPLLASQAAADLPPGCISGDVEDDGEDCTSTTADGPTAAVTAPQNTATSTPNRVASLSDRVTSIQNTSSSTSFFEGGFLTYFDQRGNAGACGKVHSDWDLICALDSAIYDNGAFCGKQILIQGLGVALGKSVTVTVADECPTCKNNYSLDLSHGAFLQITTYEQGMVPARWKFLD